LSSQPNLEQPFQLDLEYYEGRADGIASVNGVSVAEARRDLAARHGFGSWGELCRHVEAMRSGEEPPTSFVLAYQALEADDRERLEELLDEFPDLVSQRGTNGNDLLGMAGDLGIVSLLLKRGADPNRGNDYGWTAIRTLVELGADPNQRGTFGGPSHGEGVTALHLAAQAGRRDAVVTLLDLGADPLITDELHGANARGWAKVGGHEELAELLATL
jgi:ankyrin repeat protein